MAASRRSALVSLQPHTGQRVALVVPDQLVQEVPRLVAINVTAPPKVLAARLAARGREAAADIEARLTRADLALPAGIEAVTVENDASLEEGVARFVAALEAASLRLRLKPMPINGWRDAVRRTLTKS